MSTKLSGHNFLIVDKRKSEATRLSDGLIQMGANVYIAHDLKHSKLLQEKCDFDVVVVESSFLTGVGEVISQDPGRYSAKSAPLLFAYGSEAVHTAKLLKSKGVIRVFESGVDPVDLAEGIKPFLFNAREYVQQLKDMDLARLITLVLQNPAGKWTIELTDLHDDGVSILAEANGPVGETAVLTVVIPDPQNPSTQNFTVRLDRPKLEKTEKSEFETIRMKVLMKDKERWGEFIRLVEAKQMGITNFLLASSGR